MASYQIEGSWNKDGKGLSIWDVFCHEPERIDCGHTGDIACDHYNRFKEKEITVVGNGIPEIIKRKDGSPKTANKWPITPE